MANEPHIQEIDSDSDDDQGNSAIPSMGADGKTLNRAEKKSRKAIQKLGLKPYNPSESGKILRVCIKKQKSILFVLSNPDVWKSNDNSTYVCFGEARIEDTNAMQRQMMGAGGANPNAMAGNMQNFAQMMQQQKAAAGAQGAVKDASESDAPSSGDSPKKAAADSGNVDVEDKDIELVITQVGCTREKAVEALKKHNNDIVEAIMSFNM